MSTVKGRSSVPADIAIVGFACECSGVAHAEDLWTTSCDGNVNITDDPMPTWRARWSDSFYSADPAFLTMPCGFMSEVFDIDERYFGLSRDECFDMDPQQKVVLRVARSALENAGYSFRAMSGSNVGVFIGVGPNEYAHLKHTAAISAHDAIGNSAATISGRLSHSLGVRGPSVSLDTACSSSLVAVHYARRSLEIGEIDMAIVGGVNVIVTPFSTGSLAKAGLLASDGRCRTFDERATGYVRAEGCGVVILKRVQDAKRDADQIHARLVGSAVNNDGRTASIAMPSADAQRAVLASALLDSGMKSNAVTYLECHGTGTKRGDDVELRAVFDVYAENRDEPLYLGALKQNIGHTEPASGILGLIRAVMVLKRGCVPPSPLCTEPLRSFRWSEARVCVTTDEPVYFPHEGVAVSSFGFTGTNCHVVLQRYHGDTPSVGTPAKSKRPLVIAIPAKDGSEIGELSGQFRDALSSTDRFEPMIRTATSNAIHAPTYGVYVAATRDGLLKSLDGPATVSDRRETVWMFGGQGTQYKSMLNDVYCGDPEVWTEMLPILERFGLGAFGKSRNLTDADLRNTAVMQPVLFSLQVAWASWLTRNVGYPDAVMGHSLGEVAAAHVGGVMALDSAIELVRNRSALMAKHFPRGKTVIVFADVASIADLTRNQPGLRVGAINADSQYSIVVGTDAEVSSVAGLLRDGGYSHRVIDTTFQFHSGNRVLFAEEFRASLSRLEYFPARIEFISSLSASSDDEQFTEPEYWVDQACQCVNFRQALLSLSAEPPRHFVEISARPVLTSLVRSTSGFETSSFTNVMGEGTSAHALVKALLATSPAALASYGVEEGGMLRSSIEVDRRGPAHAEVGRQSQYHQHTLAGPNVQLSGDVEWFRASWPESTNVVVRRIERRGVELKICEDGLAQIELHDAGITSTRSLLQSFRAVWTNAQSCQHVLVVVPSLLVRRRPWAGLVALVKSLRREARCPIVRIVEVDAGRDLTPPRAVDMEKLRGWWLRRTGGAFWEAEIRRREQAQRSLADLARDVAGRTVIITGASGSLGRALIQWLTFVGSSRILALGRKATRIPRFPGVDRVFSIDVDLSVADKVDHALSAHFGRFSYDILIHLAGSTDDGRFEDTPVQSFLKLEADKVGSLQNLLAAMPRAPESIVASSSIAALLGSPGQANYVYSNENLAALCDDLASSSLNVCSVYLGPIDMLAGMVDIRSGQRRAFRRAGIGLLTIHEAIHGLVSAIGARGRRIWCRGTHAAMASAFRSADEARKDSALVATSISPSELTDRVRRFVADLRGVLVPDVDDRSSFSDLGMDSLAVVELAHVLKEEFGVDVDIGHLTQANSIVEVVRQARSGLDQPDDDADGAVQAVRLRAGRSAPPLFLLPPLGGYLMCYDELIRALSPARTVYGFQGTHYHGGLKGSKSIREMAWAYLRTIITVVPNGPYLLLGWSFGGVMAYELAHLLEQSGRKAEFIGIIDAHLPVRSTDPMDVAEVERAVIARYAEERQLGTVVAASTFDESIERVVALEQSTASHAKNIWQERTFLRPYLYCMRDNMIALGNCAVPQVDSRIDIFRASTPMINRPFDAEDTLGWEQRTRGDIDVYYLPGDHQEILVGTSARKLAQLVSDRVRDVLWA